jgi:predicted metal-dependent hydrolase
LNGQKWKMSSTPVYKLTVGDEEIDVYRKRIKHIHLAIYPPDGRLRISAPLRVDDATLSVFVMSKTNWIAKQRANLLTLHSQWVRPELKYNSGEHHLYRGKNYLLNIIHQQSGGRVEVRDDMNIDVYVKLHANKEQRRQVLIEWYRSQLKQLIPPLIEKWQPLIGIEVKEWRVKKMKTRWGTCNITAQRIWLNLELIKKPAICLEYVVVHEMVHFLERYHNARFKAHMDRFIPNWREIKLALNAS